LSVQHADIGPDGNLVVRADWSTVVVEVPSGRIVRKVPAGSSRPIASFRPDGKLLAVGTNVAGVEGRVTRVELVNPDSGRIVQQLSGDLPSLGSLVFSSDGRRLGAASANSLNALRRGILIWDLIAESPPEPVQIDGPRVDVLAFNPNSSRLATGSPDPSFRSGEVQLWDTVTGRDLATWSITSGVPQDLAFDSEGRQLRVVSFDWGRSEVRVTRLDATPLAPEIEAVDLINRLGPVAPLNAELAAKIESEAGVDSAVRAAALSMARERFESFNDLRSQAVRWLELPAPERTPELMHRALVHIEHAMRQLDSPNVNTLGIQGEARYRNGQYSEALASLRQAESRRDDTTEADPGLPGKIQAYIVMAEAKLRNRAKAETALANYRRLWAEANPKATTSPPLLIEVEKTMSDAFHSTRTTR
jgi:hypothetical protein